jgi:hypothetical protein
VGRIQELDEMDTLERREEETGGSDVSALHHIRSRTRSHTNEILIDWEIGDPENPYNWTKVSLYYHFDTNAMAEFIFYSPRRSSSSLSLSY